MSIWLLHLPLTNEDEASIEARTHLPLPLEDVPDLSMIHTPLECRHLLQALYPEDPPEAIARRCERIWKLHSGVQTEDIIAVPLPKHKQVALAEVSGPKEYRVEEGGGDRHLVAVTWHKRIPWRRLNKHREVFQPGGEMMQEIMNAQLRILIRDTLPYRYNRFARWKWIMTVFFLLGIARLAARLLQH